MSSDEMTFEKFQVIGRQMIADARTRFRKEAMRLCYSDEERSKADKLADAVGEVSPEEALLAFERWLQESRGESQPPQEQT